MLGNSYGLELFCFLGSAKINFEMLKRAGKKSYAGSLQKKSINASDSQNCATLPPKKQGGLIGV
jgi:hypothetical protein